MELYDRVSGPAEKMSKAAEHFEKSMLKAGQSTERVARAQKELSAERIAVMTEGAHLAVEAVDELLGKLVEFGRETLHAADYERTSGIIFESFAGSAAGGAALFEKAQDFASKAGIKIHDAVDIFENLAKGRVKDTGEDFFVLAQAATDLGYRTHQSAASVADGFTKILTKNQLASHELRRLTELGIPVEILGRHLGVTATNAEELAAALNGKHISGSKAVQAIVSSLEELEGGRIGNITKSIGEGFEGASNRISGAWEKALGAFSKTDAFKHILEDMEKIAKSMEDPKFIKSVTDFASAMTSVAESMAKIVPSAKTIHNVFGGGFGDDLSDRFDRGAEQVKANQEGKGKSYFDGGLFAQWLRARAEKSSKDGSYFNGGLVGRWFKERGEKNAQEEIKGYSGPAGIDAHSPSRVFERLGGHAADGFSLGYIANRDDTLGIPTASRPSAAATQTPHRLELHQTFEIHAAHGVDLEELARRISELSVTSLESPLESLALSMGSM